MSRCDWTRGVGDNWQSKTWCSIIGSWPAYKETPADITPGSAAQESHHHSGWGGRKCERGRLWWFDGLLADLTNAFKFQDKWKLSQLQMIFQWRTYNHKYSDSQMDFFGKCIPNPHENRFPWSELNLMLERNCKKVDIILLYKHWQPLNGPREGYCLIFTWQLRVDSSEHC